MGPACTKLSVALTLLRPGLVLVSLNFRDCLVALPDFGALQVNRGEVVLKGMAGCGNPCMEATVEAW